MSSYAGDLLPLAAWEKLSRETEARLIDVRTQAEWQFVGLPDMSALEKQPLLISWQVFPAMTRNPAFAQQVAAQGVATDTPLLFLCRSGVRSLAAAELMASLGYRACFNIADGFEGALDDGHHRGRLGGWKAAGLPWLQS